MTSSKPLWQRALEKRARQQRKRAYERSYRRRQRFELKVQRMRGLFTQIEILCAKLIES
jgi:hypothetical protein